MTNGLAAMPPSAWIAGGCARQNMRAYCSSTKRRSPWSRRLDHQVVRRRTGLRRHARLAVHGLRADPVVPERDPGPPLPREQWATSIWQMIVKFLRGSPPRATVMSAASGSIIFSLSTPTEAVGRSDGRRSSSSLCRSSCRRVYAPTALCLPTVLLARKTSDRAFPIGRAALSEACRLREPPALDRLHRPSPS